MWRKVLVLAAVAGVFPFVVLGMPPVRKPFPLDQVIPTLETSLQELAQQPPVHAEAFAASLGIKLNQGRVCVVVETKGDLPEAALTQIGGTIVSRAETLHLVKVEIPPAKLIDLAQLPGVAFVRRPYRPVLATISEGVDLAGAYPWHQAGWLGQGVKVAIIDKGFAGLSNAVATGVLGNITYTHDYTGDGLETGEVHGTACAEIVHEMAPAAQLLLMKIDDGVDLWNAVTDAITLGAKVISVSMVWINTNFYDGSGPIGETATYAVQHGILWVNSAGNSADGLHWEGDWSDPDGDGWLNFYSTDEGDNFTLRTGDTVAIYLTWDAWPKSDQDYELYLFNEQGQMVKYSTNYQTGTQEPCESLSYTAPATGSYGVVIFSYPTQDHPRLELFVDNTKAPGVRLEYAVAASSIPAPGNAASVLTVGAVNWRKWGTGPQEAFSSQGPTNATRYASSIIKPDICGPDGVSSAVYGHSFYGTSAAAPHVAGAAALVWSAHPNWSEDQVRQLLETNAVDMGPYGKDNYYGYGELQLFTAIPCAYAISPTSKSFGATGGSDSFNVTTSKLSCQWTAHSDSTWITITSGNSGTGDGTVYYTVATNTGSARTGHITVENNTFTITQASGSSSSSITYTYGAVAGWYMVSLPTNGDVASLFGTALYTYNPAIGKYIAATNIEPQKGYWAYLPASKVISASGTQVTGNVTISLPVAGWYQISAPWSSPRARFK